jgi:AcrR family transcriptional regulator
MSSPTGEQTRETPDREQEAAREIVGAVTELLESGGYSAVTMRAVARRARVSLATVYRLFPTQSNGLRTPDELVVTAIEHWMAEHAYSEVLARAADETLYDTLMRMLRYVFEPWERSPRMLEVFHRVREGPRETASATKAGTRSHPSLTAASRTSTPRTCTTSTSSSPISSMPSSQSSPKAGSRSPRYSRRSNVRSSGSPPTTNRWRAACVTTWMRARHETSCTRVDSRRRCLPQSNIARHRSCHQWSPTGTDSVDATTPDGMTYKLGGTERSQPNSVDGCQVAHNPKVVGSKPTPATI